MRTLILALLTLVFLPFSAMAQSEGRPNTILVLDGSGSMWGQIDGVNKIVIARNVIAEMLAEMADDVSLGLTVYGHRQRGACNDIETIVEPAPFTQDRILQAVNAINPRGRTPMADAVIAAAQSLRHTEEPATVILVSDGIENCNPDPCAIAAELEAAGVAFTAHVIGFDVASEPDARAQMQCIADNTGGLFLTADNAAELSEALNTVVAAAPTMMRLEAQVEPNGELATRPITWTIIGEANTVVANGMTGPSVDFAFDAGLYTIQATRQEPGGPVTYQTNAIVEQGQSDLIIVRMPPIVETSPVTFRAAVEPNGAVPTSVLNWTLRDAAGAVLLGPVAAPGGNVALLPGEYVLSVERVSTGTTHEARFAVAPNTPQEVVIPLPAIPVEVTFIARIGSISGLSVPDEVVWDVSPLQANSVVGNPGTFLMPPGAYTVTGYWTTQEVEQTADFVVVGQNREVVVVFPEPVARATLTSTTQGVAGSTIEVGWSGPGADNDWIGFYPPENTSSHGYEAITRVGVSTGNPVLLRLPPLPGTYELRYIQGSNRQILASMNVQVLPAPATIGVPTGPAGGTASVTWTGPAYEGDWIGFYDPSNTSNHGYEAAVRVAVEPGANPATLRYPARPGTYEIRYIMGLGRTQLASQTVEVTPVTATITTAPTGVAGALAEIGWTGPNYENDWIGFYDPANTANHGYEAITRISVADGNPLQLRYPPNPGTYELRYIQSHGRVQLAAVTIEVTDVTATLTTAATGVAGALGEVGWTGPNNPNDWIGFYPVGNTASHAYEAITRIAVAEGNPLGLRYPPNPGTYELRYVMSQGRTVLARQTIEVTPVTGTLTTAASGVAGSLADIGWTGPNNPNDWIGFYPVGNTSNHAYEAITRIATAEGNPLQLRYPPNPGTYELRYVMSQGRTVLARQTIEVTPVTATLTTAPTGMAGAAAEIGWTGPDNPNDWIGFYPVGNTSNHSYEAITRIATADGNPLTLAYPPNAGTYELRYVMSQGRTVLARQTIEVSAAQGSLTVPATLNASSRVMIGWTGPGNAPDWIGVYPVNNTSNHSYEAVTRVNLGNNPANPIELRLPDQVGTYELRYVMALGRTVVARQTIEVTETAASVTGPASAIAGSVVEIGWSGPNQDGDYVGIGRVGTTGGSAWETFAYTRDGNPARVPVPASPGDYTITYFQADGRVPLATAALTVTDVTVTLEGPTEAAAGTTIDVAWTGPNYEGDYIGIGRVGATGGAQWETYTHTRDGTPARIQVPAAPGDYEITYFMRQDRRAVATIPLTVTEQDATLTAPATGIGGSTIEVGWTGPGFADDYIGVGLVGATGGAAWDNFAYTRDGNPARLLLPIQSGDYLITYFLRQDRRALVQVPISVTVPEATISAPATAVAGSLIEVAWTGPNYNDDYVGIGLVGATGGAAWDNFFYTRDGTPGRLVVPPRAGTYEITYFTRQDRTPLARTTIEVTAAPATLSAPASAAPGDQIEVTWTGPNYNDDYIGIGPVGVTGGAQWQSFAYTRDGSPARLTIPDTPGEYVIQYFMRQDRFPIAETTITVQ